MLEQGHVVAGKYRLERVIGVGGIGTVWEAVHLDLGAAVAVKFPQGAPGRADSSVRAAAERRFRREARSAAQLRNAWIVHVYDYGVDAGLPFIVMERLHGESLRERMERAAPLGLSEIASIVRQIAAALDFAHRRGVTHRDIKPSNLFLLADGEGLSLKLLDFGIATWAGAGAEGETESLEIVGSIAYMSPEQAAGQKVDARSDLWSLAVVVHQLLFGRLPFEGRSVAQIATRLAAARFELPSRAFGAKYAALTRSSPAP